MQRMGSSRMGGLRENPIRFIRVIRGQNLRPEVLDLLSQASP
jgi:hypothetical protein